MGRIGLAVLEIAPIGHGRRVGRVSQRWVVQARRMSCRVMMAVLARAMKASIEVCAALGADLEPA